MIESKLSDTEAYILRLFWAHGPMKTDELSLLVANKGWKPTTLLTFLSRLVNKGMLAAERQGRANLYRPLVSQEEYRQTEGRAFLDEMYGGSARDFLAALVDGNSLSPGELAELKSWLAAQEVDGHD